MSHAGAFSNTSIINLQGHTRAKAGVAKLPACSLRRQRGCNWPWPVRGGIVIELPRDSKPKKRRGLVSSHWKRSIKGHSLRRRIVAAAGLLLIAVSPRCEPASANRLQDQVNRLVDLGYEQPQISLDALRALENGSPPGADSRRIIEAGIGLVAADSGLSEDAHRAIDELDRLAPVVGAMAHADALLVRADLENELDQTQRGIADITAAVSAYAPFCDPALTRDVRGCNPFNWFYANMFAGVGVSGQGEHGSGSAAAYFAAAQDIAEHANRPDQEARALAFMAKLVQDDGNADLSDRILQH
jgi:hypothetical protein